MLPSTGQQEASPRPSVARPEDGVPAPGQMIAEKYEVEHILGQGGMGVVLAARHLDLGQRVAIKFMRAEYAQDALAAERFLREARASVALGSAHVARVLDVGRLETGAPYMVMEYLAGEDLEHVLRRNGPLPIPSAVGLVLQACDALAEAHAHGIVHRDLKPANLFVSTTTDGAPLIKVLDFGISKAVVGEGPDQASLTASGVVMGSPGYMSPEQVRSSRDVDLRGDIWSLGVILYELLSGVSPFVGETLGETFAKIISEDPTPLRQLRPDVPAGLARVVEGCLQRRLEARIDSIATLASKLVDFAPEDSRPIVERIRRLSRPLGAGPRHDTLVAPEHPSSVDRAPLTPGDRPIETGPAWLRSASRVPRRRATPAAAGALGAAGVVGALGLGLWWLGIQRSAESLPKPVVPSSPVAPGTVAPAPPPPSHAPPQSLPPEAPSDAQTGPVDSGARSVTTAPLRHPPPRVPAGVRPQIVEPPAPAPVPSPKPASNVESNSRAQPAPKPAPSLGPNAKPNDPDVY